MFQGKKIFRSFERKETFFERIENRIYEINVPLNENLIVLNYLNQDKISTFF